MRAARSPSVVVGIDGSQAAVQAALWAVDEAVSRDIPLRLVYAIEPYGAPDTNPQHAAQILATGELAVRYAFSAVELTEKPVKIEVEILPADIQLVVAGRRDQGEVGELLGPTGQAALQNTDCSVLVCDRQRLL
jgi:nucleotide-binding universal stress UspA family protein